MVSGAISGRNCVYIDQGLLPAAIFVYTLSYHPDVLTAKVIYIISKGQLSDQMRTVCMRGAGVGMRCPCRILCRPHIAIMIYQVQTPLYRVELFEPCTRILREPPLTVRMRGL